MCNCKKWGLKAYIQQGSSNNDDQHISRIVMCLQNKNDKCEELLMQFLIYKVTKSHCQ